MDWKKHGWLWSISMFILGNVQFSLDIQDWILEAIFSLLDTGYFQLDRRIIFFPLKPKYDAWLSLTILQGHWTRNETFQTNNISWLNDIRTNKGGFFLRKYRCICHFLKHTIEPFIIQNLIFWGVLRLY